MFLIVRCYGALPSNDGFVRSSHLTPAGVGNAKHLGELFVAQVGFALHNRSVLVFYQQDHPLSSSFLSTLSAIAAGAGLTYPQATPKNIEDMLAVCDAHAESPLPIFICVAEEHLRGVVARCARLCEAVWIERILPGQALLVDKGRASVLGSPIR